MIDELNYNIKVYNHDFKSFTKMMENIMHVFLHFKIPFDQNTFALIVISWLTLWCSKIWNSI